MKRLLLLSNSMVPGYGYLEYAKDEIVDFLKDEVKEVLFIPYAGVTVSYDDYEAKVKEKMNEFGYELVSIHKKENPIEAVENAEVIFVGGGNTFHLLTEIYKNGLLEPIRNKIESGTPFMGWSAGSNLACPTIKTTNDMPIIQPPSFEALDLIPFQINPHFTDARPEGHKGESRSDRIAEFLVVNKDMTVVGLPEGCLFRIEGEKIKLVGNKDLKIFKNGAEPYFLNKDSNLDILL